LRKSYNISIVEDLSTWDVQTPGVRDVLEAIRLHRKYQLSFWDAMILQSALQAGCKIIWSEDLSVDQVYEGVRVINPFI
jgi:predicted nucleic acid-binding protein